MHFPLASRSWPRILSVAVAGLLLVIGLPARADIILSVQDVSAVVGSTGNTLEVDLENTGGSAVDIASFSFEISVAGGSGVTLTGADIRYRDERLHLRRQLALRSGDLDVNRDDAGCLGRRDAGLDETWARIRPWPWAGFSSTSPDRPRPAR